MTHDTATGGDAEARGAPAGSPHAPAGAVPDADADPRPGERVEAAERARGLLRQSPWAEATERITLWLVSPPRGMTPRVRPPVEAWLAVDRAAAQTLPGDGQRLSREGAIAGAPPRASGEAGVRASLFTAEALAALLSGEGRRALEARWSLSHAELLADRLGRHERLIAESNRSPAGAVERALRGAYLAAAGALPALPHAPGDGGALEMLPAAGEAAAALARLACLLDEESHPPLAWLLPAARETRLGRRIWSWFDDLALAISGDEAAERRVVNARDAVLDQARMLVRQRIGERPWLQEPASYLLNPRRS